MPKVAIIDDDQAILESFQFLLNFAGILVATYNGPEAFLADTPCRFRRIILDQYMPHMTGLELLRELRKRGASGQTMLLTSPLTHEIVVQAAELGVTRIAEKPLRSDELFQFVASDARFPCVR